MNGKYISELQKKTIIINFVKGKEKSLLKIGYIRIYLENKFNWLQKKMFKLLLGIEIVEKVESDE